MAGLSAFSAQNTLAASNPNYGITGQMAPELDVPYWIDAEGNDTQFKLADQRGKFVFMKCWQAWCPGCHSRGFPTLQKVTEAFIDEPKVLTLGIQTTFEGFSTNSKNRVREMQLRYDLPILMGHDTGKGKRHERPTTMLNYRTGGTPWLILVAPDGKVIFDDYHINTENAIAFLRTEVAKLA